LYLKRPKLKRLPKRKAVTVCIGALHITNQQNAIIVATDTKMTFYGGYFSADGVTSKIVNIHDDWMTMISGNSSAQALIVDALIRNAKRLKKNTLRDFALLCSKTYRGVREAVIENEILLDHDLNSFQEYTALKESDREVYDTVTAKIHDEEQLWSFLVVGFDQQERPHLFVLGEKGKIQYCDMQGFATVGSGEFRAMVALSSPAYRRNSRLGECMCHVLAAKFAAESAEGVGQETFCAVLKPSQGRYLPILSDGAIANVRAELAKLPKFPKDCPKYMEDHLAVTEGLSEGWEEAEKARKVQGL
jgi:20S proteasome alpha/beta subunit